MAKVHLAQGAKSRIWSRCEHPLYPNPICVYHVFCLRRRIVASTVRLAPTLIFFTNEQQAPTSQTHTDAQTHRSSDAQTHIHSKLILAFCCDACAFCWLFASSGLALRTEGQTQRRTDTANTGLLQAPGRRRAHNINPKSQCDRANNFQEPAPGCKTKSQ